MRWRLERARRDDLHLEVRERRQVAEGRSHTLEDGRSLVRVRVRVRVRARVRVRLRVRVRVRVSVRVRVRVRVRTRIRYGHLGLGRADPHHNP